MFHRLESSDPRFKTLTFHSGLNILLAQKRDETAGSSTTRNSVGKSSVVDLLHFLLGGTRDKNSIVSSRSLDNDTFLLQMDWPNLSESLHISRAVTSTTIRLYPVPSSVGRGQLSLDTSVDLGLNAWQEVIGRDLFHLPEEHRGITSRALLSFYMRRVRSGGFNSAVKTIPTQSSYEGATLLSYMLGLDWRLAAGHRVLAEREATRRKLVQAVKDPSFGRIVGKAAELRARAGVLERAVAELRRQIDSFVVVPEFEILQREADELSDRISRLRIADAADRRNVQDIENALSQAAPTESNYLTALYNELGSIVAPQLHRRLDEVAEFHTSIVRNRTFYLEEELAATRARLRDRAEERARLGEAQATILKRLQEGGALSDLTTLQEVYGQRVSELSTLRDRLQAAETIEESRTEISQQKLELKHNIAASLRDYDAVAQEANLLFSSYAAQLYGTDRDAYLGFSAEPGGLNIQPHIESGRGRGVGNMVIFCLDLTVAVIAARAGRGPRFLVHDSHLFDGVDSAQVARALALAWSVSRDEGLQYVTSLNSDDFAKVSNEVERASEAGDSTLENLSDSIMEVRLTDASETGGLFGYKLSD